MEVSFPTEPIAQPEPAPLLAPAARHHRLIAIRRHSEARTSDVAENVAILADPEAQQDARSRLAEAGLEEADRLSPRDRASGAPSYLPLPLAQCIVLDAADPSNLLEARDALAEDYMLCPDIPLALPGSFPARRDASQYRLTPDASSGADILELSGLRDAASRRQRGAGVVIAVLDTGCDADHDEFAERSVDFTWVPPALGARVRSVRGFDTSGHGTHVCGIAAGLNRGLAPEADLLVTSVVESERTLTTLDRLLRGLNWILRQITTGKLEGRPTILNFSLGFRRQWLAPSEVQAALIGVREILALLTETFHVLPIAAVGNDGPGEARAPAYFPEVLAVGAVDANLEPAPFSGGGPGPPPFEGRMSPDVVGFGVDVASAVERDVPGHSLYGLKSGTSMAAPYVVGVAALVAAETGLRGAELRSHLLSHLEPLQQPPERGGGGLVRFAL